MRLRSDGSSGRIGRGYRLEKGNSDTSPEASNPQAHIPALEKELQRNPARVRYWKCRPCGSVNTTRLAKGLATSSANPDKKMVAGLAMMTIPPTRPPVGRGGSHRGSHCMTPDDSVSGTGDTPCTASLSTKCVI